MPTTSGFIGNSWSSAFCDWFVNNSAISYPMGNWMGLLTGTPGEDGSYTEIETPGTKGYVRQSVAGAWSASGGNGSNTALIEFGPVTGSAWTQITHWGIFPFSTGGGMMAFGDCNDATLGVGDRYRFEIGDIDITTTAPASRWQSTSRDDVIEHFFSVAELAATQDRYLSLYKTTGPLAGGSEVATHGSSGYTRQLLASHFDAAVDGSSSNKDLITFGPATALWGTVTFLGIHNSTVGSAIGQIELPDSKVIKAGGYFLLDTGALTFVID